MFSQSVEGDGETKDKVVFWSFTCIEGAKSLAATALGFYTIAFVMI